ncbi:tripartite tricarboxylate transporter substrate-binding protein [Advenella mimigardefordensis]|uniref:Putative Bug-like extracytoplasmic solute binding receptor, TTT family-like protein n=1 Tax=Advenella mimigardefordensis (strain DSM 17166 / LMG 22922 / DPN7) TaxID=1247726 RepID=W0PLB6_ADVMD|nr:tripartite tricarboxylate transporter substrate-binding protein [Advenella mimigardefordensis]AHG65768.1 putative Bug-like extracytoplasmic solute binding receptor, TTT family-like protein [Advenella mimigardefordensis DPN7]
MAQDAMDGVRKFVHSVAVIVATLNKGMHEIINDTAFQKKLIDQGIEPMGGTPDELAKRIDNEVKQFGQLVKQINLKVE